MQIQIADLSDAEHSFLGNWGEGELDADGTEPTPMPATIAPSMTTRAASQPFVPTLPLVLRTCPTAADYAPGRTTRDYFELRQAAELLCILLGMSTNAWQTAVEVIGKTDAVLTIVLIHEGDSICSPGGICAC